MWISVNRIASIKRPGNDSFRRQTSNVRSGHKAHAAPAQPTGSARLRRLFVLSSLASLALLAVPSPSGACALTNPQCVVNNVKDTADQVEDTANDTVEDVQDHADDAVDQVNGTVDDVKETADGAVGDVEKTVDETLNPGGGGGENPTFPNPPTEPGVDDPTKPDVKGEAETRAGKPERNAGGPVDRGSLAGGREPGDLVNRTPNEPLLAPITLAGQVDEPAESLAGHPELNPGLGETAIEAVKDFAFPLLLTVLVGAFLLAQHMVDRKEPKLLFAPIDQDLLSFE
jgi:hypothetical protein